MHNLSQATGNKGDEGKVLCSRRYNLEDDIYFKSLENLIISDTDEGRPSNNNFMCKSCQSACCIAGFHNIGTTDILSW